MKRSAIEKIFHDNKTILGDRILLTDRYRGGKTGQRYYTLNRVGNHALHVSDSGKDYTFAYNAIENIEIVVDEMGICRGCGAEIFPDHAECDVCHGKRI